MFSRAQAESFGRELAANPVARALALSVLFHFVLISGMEVGHKAGFWKHSLLPQKGKSRLEEEVAKAEELLKKQIEQALQQVPEAQLVFVEVDPSTAAPEPPKETKFYSAQNSIASNPDPADKNLPKIDGQQEKIVKTFDTLKPDPRAPQPKPQEAKPQQKAQPKVAESKAPQRPVPQEEPKPTRNQEAGETLLARAVPKAKAQPDQKAAPSRPRTVAEAKAQKGIIEGQRMRQDGGVKRSRLNIAMDVKATPFGSYDNAFIAAVQSSWFRQLEERQLFSNDAGKVVVEFRLNYDGRITGLRVVDSQVNDHLAWMCQRAVLDVDPFMKFPSDMRRLVKNDYREIRFTFYYN